MNKQKKVILFLIISATMSVVKVEAASTLYFSEHANYFSKGDSVSIDSLYQLANKVLSEANELKPKATEFKNLYSGYKERAKGKKCDVALQEITAALDMAEKALKDCEEVSKLVAKALKSKKPEDVKKIVHLAEKKCKSAKYYLHQSEDRKKEVEFELKGC